MSSVRSELAREEWSRGWPLVMVSALGMSITTVHLYSMGVLLEPLQDSFGWTRTQITLGQTIVSSAGALLAPVSGMLMDRWGPRRIALPCLVIFCAVLASLATVNGSLVHWYAMWTMLALAQIGLKPNVWCGAVASSFSASRALAMAIAISGTGIGSMFVPSLANALNMEVGWRGAYIGLAGMWLILTLPLCYLFLRTPRDAVALRPGAQPRVAASSLPGLTVRQGLRSFTFYRLLLFGFLFSLSSVGMTFNFVPLLRDEGIDTTTAAAVAGVIGVMSIIGRLITGSLLDRFHGSIVGGIAALMPLAPTLMLLYLQTNVPVALTAAGVFGFALGAELDILAYFASRYMGLRSYGTLFGFLVSGLAAGTALGPITAALVRDLTGSYALMLWFTIPCYLLSAIMIFTSGPYPDFGSGAERKPVPADA